MKNRHFTLVVVGDNPDDLVKKYDSKITVEPYIVYEFKDAQKIYDEKLNMYRKMLSLINEGHVLYDNIKGAITEIISMTATDYFLLLTEEYDIDENTGDAISNRNPDGKYDHCSIGNKWALPLKTKNGEEVFSAVKSEVDWPKMHLYNQYPYEFAWDSVMGGKKPKTEEENKIYENMKNRTSYFQEFGNRENYIASNTSFWGYAFLSEKEGWVELEGNENQFEWVIKFYDRFIKPLKDDEKISIYECVRI